MKFLADCMLGKLAKWLRMLGHDTEFIRNADDDDLVRIAVRENRMLLTRDRRLCDRRMLTNRCMFVDWGTTSEQVKQVFDKLKINIDHELLFTRCTVCNGRVVPIDKASVKEHVPPYVYKTQEEFAHCLGCNRIYWCGTHIKHVLQALEEESLDFKHNDKDI